MRGMSRGLDCTGGQRKMPTKEQRESLIEAIRFFKEPGVSDLDAALNLITSHAKTIQDLTGLLGDCNVVAGDIIRERNFKVWERLVATVGSVETSTILSNICK